VVCSASDSVSNERVAIKKIGNAFENATDSRRTLREIQLLRHLRHDNVVALHDVLRPPSLAEFNDVYLVYELMDTGTQAPPPRARCLALAARRPQPTPAAALQCALGRAGRERAHG